MKNKNLISIIILVMVVIAAIFIAGKNGESEKEPSVSEEGISAMNTVVEIRVGDSTLDMILG